MDAEIGCPVCSKPHFSDVDSLRSALIKVANSPLTCPACNETFNGLDKLTIHLFSHVVTKSSSTVSPDAAAVADISNAVQFEIQRIQDDKEFRCEICNFAFSDANILEMHLKLLHQTAEDQQTGLYSYHCHLCSKKFKMKGSLMVHLRVAHFGFLNMQNKTEENSAPKKKWSCEECQKCFSTKYFLKKHKRLHTGETPYFCEKCNKTFTFQQSYRKHTLYHSSEKPYICSQCGRAFKELSTLHNHERIHSGERPFACETCGKCFRQRVSYLVHKRIHTGAMPYKCNACNKSFRYKVSQRSHKCAANFLTQVNGNFNATATSSAIEIKVFPVNGTPQATILDVALSEATELKEGDRVFDDLIV